MSATYSKLPFLVIDIPLNSLKLSKVKPVEIFPVAKVCYL
ncbi:MAG: hypothetical protein CM15mP7_1110 [Pelagibacteraceae bacterium]|nr:MAG: hypothetical protein CM15mP7_1110 [Pelagibacteraceae bacterium]